MRYYNAVDFVPDTSIGYHVRCIHQASAAALEPVFAEEGLTLSQWSALVSIHYGRGNTGADLARDLAHDKGAMTRLLDLLEGRGWVTRTRDADDRRCINLALTEQGRAVAERCRKRVAECWNGWLGNWAHEDVDAALAMLQRLRATVDAAASRGGCA